MYHKSKTYAGLLGGAKEGMKSGLRISFWAGVFMGSEELMDRLRTGRIWGYKEGGRGGGVDAAGTVMASMATAGGFCLWSRWSHWPWY